MLCSQCRKNEASIHFTSIINGNAVELELCEGCAKKSGVSSSFSFPASVQPALNDMMDLLANWHSTTAGSGAIKSACSACRWTIVQFRKTGRMGCSECYLHFQLETQNFLKKIHGATTHKGKKAPAEVAKTKVRDKEKTLFKMESELQRAIKEEQFELAAALRDKISDFRSRNP